MPPVASNKYLHVAYVRSSLRLTHYVRLKPQVDGVVSQIDSLFLSRGVCYAHAVTFYIYYVSIYVTY